MRDKPRYDGHNRKPVKGSSSKDLRHRKLRRRWQAVWRELAATKGRDQG